MAKKLTKSEVIASEIVEMSKKLGWRIEVRGQILTIKKSIRPGSNEDFVRADGEYWSILGMLPTTSPGSSWGTDGGSVGGLSAMQGGTFTMNKSGGSIRVLKALAKMMK